MPVTTQEESQDLVSRHVSKRSPRISHGLHLWLRLEGKMIVKAAMLYLARATHVLSPSVKTFPWSALPWPTTTQYEVRV